MKIQQMMLGLGFVLMTQACQQSILFEEEPIVEEVAKYPYVHADLIPYFESFEAEGRKRGYAIDLSTEDLTGQFQYINEGNVAGQCSYSSYHPNRVTVDIEFWERASHLSREMIVFHELGHCYLNRDHLESSFDNGYCKSIMRSGTCCCRDAYVRQNRSYYLDELFAGTN